MKREISSLTAIILLFAVLVTYQTPSQTPIKTTNNFSAQPSAISWGEIRQGESVNVTVNLQAKQQSTYNINLTNPQPSNLFEFITVTNNGSGQIAKTETIEFSLKVNQTAPQIPFSFSIVIGN